MTAEAVLTEEELAEARAFYDVSDNAMKLAVFDYGARLLATLDQRTRERDDQRDDALRLHREKMDHYDARLAAEREVAALREALIAVKYQSPDEAVTRIPAKIWRLVDAALAPRPPVKEE